MLAACLTLLACQLVGEILSRGFDLIVPGPVIGLVLLLAGLALSSRRRVPVRDEPLQEVKDDNTSLDRVSGTLLANLSLLFVPPGVGIINYAAAISEHGIALGVALVVSGVLALGVTAVVFTALTRRASGEKRE